MDREMQWLDNRPPDEKQKARAQDRKTSIQ